MTEYKLLHTPEHLCLLKTGDKKPFYIDFLSGKLRYRCEHTSLRKELLAKALGTHPRENKFIVDATAGLGRDSFILASLGFEITLIERSPIIHALLDDAINRAKPYLEAANRMHLIHADAIDWLQSPSLRAQRSNPVQPESKTEKPGLLRYARNDKNTPDIIILDPMFPEKQKSAASQKEMVILQDLLGKDTDADQLFKAALTCGAKRIVVKRPRLAENIADREPSFSLQGKSSRFDVYIVQP